MEVAAESSILATTHGFVWLHSEAMILRERVFDLEMGEAALHDMKFCRSAPDHAIESIDNDVRGD
jgi:hypothetical protein